MYLFLKISSLNEKFEKNLFIPESSLVGRYFPAIYPTLPEKLGAEYFPILSLVVSTYTSLLCESASEREKSETKIKSLVVPHNHNQRWDRQTGTHNTSTTFKDIKSVLLF